MLLVEAGLLSRVSEDIHKRVFVLLIVHCKMTVSWHVNSVELFKYSQSFVVFEVIVNWYDSDSCLLKELDVCLWNIR